MFSTDTHEGPSFTLDLRVKVSVIGLVNMATQEIVHDNIIEVGQFVNEKHFEE